MTDLQELSKWLADHPYVTVTFSGYQHAEYFHIKMVDRMNGGVIRSCMIDNGQLTQLQLQPKLIDFLDHIYDELQIGVNNA